MISRKHEQGFAHLALVIILVVALVVAAGLYVRGKQDNKTTTNNKTSADTKQLKHPGVITFETFAASLDASGAPVNPTHKFAANTPSIYVSLGLNNAKATDRVEYTRYLNGKFLDNGSELVKAGAKHASFVFSLKPDHTHPKGRYVVKTYTNGIYERSAAYTVQ